MDLDDRELTLLSEGDLWGTSQLDAIAKYGIIAAITDLTILTGGFCADRSSDYKASDDRTLSGRTGAFYTKTATSYGSIVSVNRYGESAQEGVASRQITIRPVLKSPSVFSKVYPKIVEFTDGKMQVEYGEYPQYAPDANMQCCLEALYTRGDLKKTGGSYTFDKTGYDDTYQAFQGVTYDEYEYDGKKYIRVKANSDYGSRSFELSNGEYYSNGEYVWVEVSPVIWLVDVRTQTLISKRGLLAGIRYLPPSTCYRGDFSKTEMSEYFHEHMLRDLTQRELEISLEDMTEEERAEYERKKANMKKRKNPYGLKFGEVSEEEIIRGALESGVAVFLHGKSSDGKSARVKNIDPSCVIIYLRNASPESLNGKSVYNAQTGEMIDVKPSWLKKLEEQCEKEPDRLHIVFFDEITNALPSIQGIAYNIVLDREVNGVWKLPDNARIVAAGNDTEDSLAANELAEPLFNRFAHVYIKTTTESWLKWASEHNIHPAIYSFIAYKKGKILRTKYDGEKPNADPRKWEMASKMLYATGNPEMLRALVGEDVTKEFVKFCKQQVITVEDILQDNYLESEVKRLDTATRYATTMGLTQVDDENMEKVRQFVISLGAEFVAIFDALWTHGDESRIERLAEVKLSEGGKDR